MAGTRENEHTLAPTTKGKSDEWKHFRPRKRKRDGQIDADVAVCKQSNFVVKRAGGNLKHVNAY